MKKASKMMLRFIVTALIVLTPSFAIANDYHCC